MKENISDSATELKKDSQKLLADFTKLKQLIDSCKYSADGLSGKIGPLTSKLRGVNSSLGSILKSATKHFAEQMAYNATGVKPPSNYGHALGKAMAGMFGGMRASGGNVAPGMPYIVGERGPELFTPGASGHITPNNQMQTSSRAINLVMNINTPDSDSFRRSQNQILAEAVQALRRANRNM